MPYAIVAIAVLVIVAFVILRRSRYYRSIFSEDHYAEIADWASKVIGRHPVAESSVDEGTLVATSAGLVLAYTSNINEGNRSVHFSVSQQGRYTTGAVGGGDGSERRLPHTGKGRARANLWHHRPR